MITLNKQQEEASKLIEDWYNNYKTTGKQIFVLAGFAGTGKTTLVNYLIENIIKIPKNKVAFATPTGKAASVLIQKGSEATTIHRLIYAPIINEFENTINGKTVHSKKIDFVKRHDIPKYKLIVLDEVSMVSKKIMEDLLSFGIPILATGDIGQLPAIMAEAHDLLQKPDYNLTEIVRQAEDNAILKVATMARLGEIIPLGDYNGDVQVYDSKLLTDSELKKILLEADQVICGTNSKRTKLNFNIRKLKDHNKPLPDDDEKLICELNNYEIDFDSKYSLVNGMQGYVKNFKVLDSKLKLATISFKPDFLDQYVDNILIEYGVFENNKYMYDKHQSVYLMYDGSYKIVSPMFKQSKDENKEDYLKKIRHEFIMKKQALATAVLNQFQYGYAITCHKSQGSQWDSVVIIDEHDIFNQDGNKWLYTAITRAAKKLVIIR